MKTRAWFVAAVCATLTLGIIPAKAGTAHVIVRPGSLHGWNLSNNSGRSNGRWVTGPKSAPLGKGSARLNAASGDFMLFAPAAPKDLSTFVATYKTYGASPAGFFMGVSNSAILITAPDSGSPGWQSFDAMASSSWFWDCEPDGTFDGTGTIGDFLAGTCPDSSVTVMGFGSLGSNAYIDAVKLGSSGATTIFNMEPGVIALSDARKVERDQGRRAMTFRVRLSGLNADPVHIKFATANGTAIAGHDYVAKRGTLTIPAGSRSGLVKIIIIGDTHNEANEKLKLKLSAPTNAMFGDKLAIGTIVDDE